MSWLRHHAHNSSSLSGNWRIPDAFGAPAKVGGLEPQRQAAFRLLAMIPVREVRPAPDQVGTCASVLEPLYHVLAAERLHGDDTTVPVLARGKIQIGRIWTYVRDDRPFGGPAPPAAVFYYSRDRTSEHPQRHLHTYASARYGRHFDHALACSTFLTHF